MKKWEYMIVGAERGKVLFIKSKNANFQRSSYKLTKGTDIIESYNKAGEEGWEAVGISDSTVLFKREIEN